MRRLSVLLMVILIIDIVPLIAQPQQRFINVSVMPDHGDWVYKTGQPVKFTVTITQSGSPVLPDEVRFSVMPEKMEPVSSGRLTLKNGAAVIDGGTMRIPGFLRCEVIAIVAGKEYKGMGTAAFEAEKIKPTVEMPADFAGFWNAGKEELAKVPLDSKITLLPERCTETVKVYHVSFQNIKNSRMYGILCVPKGGAKYPAILQVPGAGVRAYSGDITKAKQGFITLQVGIHGVPVNMDPSVYHDLGSGPLNGYPTFSLDNKDAYYYRRVYLGCVKAVDFIFSLPEFDGTNIGISGGSQGGALAIITSALDPRIKYLCSYYPALSDMTGYLHKRAGGWPHLFAPSNMALNNTKERIATVAYYDVVNFARNLKIPGYYSWGYNDDVCPPTSIYAAYNVITAPKQVLVVPETGHWTYPEQTEKLDNWLMAQLRR